MTRRGVPLLYALTIAGYPLVAAASSLVGMNSRIASVGLRAFVLALAASVFVLLLRRGELYRGSAWFPLLAFWLFYAIRIASDTVFFPITLGMSGWDYVIWGFGTCFFPMLGFLGAVDDTSLARAAKYCLVFSIIACVLALYATYRELSLGVSQTYLHGRLAFETLNPIALGHLGVTLALLSIHFFVGQRRLARVALVVVGLLGLFIAAAAGSRGPVAAFVICALFLILVTARDVPPHRLALGTLTMVLAGFLLVTGALLMEQTFGFRIASRLEAIQDIGADVSGRAHVQSLINARDQFVAKPLFGSALDELQEHDYPHNVVIESFMATGIFGGLMFCAFLTWGALAAIPLARDRSTRWVALLFVQQAVAALTAGALYLSAGMWCMGAAAIAIAADRRRARSAGIRSPTVRAIGPSPTLL